MHDSMKLFAAAGVALLFFSPASAQESGRLSAEYLKQATPLIHWPKGLEPLNVDVFLHNEGWIDAPPAVSGKTWWTPRSGRRGIPMRRTSRSKAATTPSSKA